MSARRAAAWLLLGVAACSPGVDRVAGRGPQADPEPPADHALAGSEWELLRLGAGSPAVATRATLQFDADRLGGYGGCNWYGSTWSLRDGRLRIGVVESTARGCAEAAMAQEQALFAALPQVAGARRVGGRLQLVDAAGATLAEWTRREVVAMDPAVLAGTRWRWADDAPGAAPAAELAFVDGRTLRGFAGCRGFTGTYRARGDRLAIDSLAMDATECDAGEAARLREERFLQAIEGIETWGVDGQRLTLRSVDGSASRFVRER